jgi:DNA primase
MGEGRGMTGDDLFARAKAVDLVQLVRGRGVKLRGGARGRGFCPICRAGEKSGSTPFSVDGAKGLFKCFACGAAGDAVKFEQMTGGWASAADAARALLGEARGDAAKDAVRRPAAAAVRVVPEARGDAVFVDGAAVAAWLSEHSVPGMASPVFDWLAARGLMPLAIDGAIDRLRWCSSAPVAAWGVRGPGDDVRPPSGVPRCGAMVAPLVRPDGAGGMVSAGAVHVTYLAPGGRAKADLRRRDGSVMPSRKMFGVVKGAGFPLTDLDGPGPLLVGEGIETVWAVAQGWDGPVRAVAVLSLDNLQGGVVKDEAGSWRIDAPEADPAKPPFTIPQAGDVVILCDADMAPVPAMVRDGRRGKPVKVRLSALQRAELCGALAAQAWLRAGATSVRAIRPRLGLDFNDAVRG